MANEFQISSLTELFDSFGDSTLYKLPTATNAAFDSDAAETRDNSILMETPIPIKFQNALRHTHCHTPLSPAPKRDVLLNRPNDLYYIRPMQAYTRLLRSALSVKRTASES